MPKLTCRFDPDDEALLVRALNTGQPEDVRAAIEHAITGFQDRLLKMGGVPVVDGRPQLMVFKPATKFDEYVLTLTLQALADQHRQIVSVHYMPNPKKLGSPDVEFVQT